MNASPALKRWTGIDFETGRGIMNPKAIFLAAAAKRRIIELKAQMTNESRSGRGD
jgi:hypothetical protein